MGGCFAAVYFEKESEARISMEEDCSGYASGESDMVEGFVLPYQCWKWLISWTRGMVIWGFSVGILYQNEKIRSQF